MIVVFLESEPKNFSDIIKKVIFNSGSTCVVLFNTNLAFSSNKENADLFQPIYCDLVYLPLHSIKIIRNENPNNRSSVSWINIHFYKY